MAEPHDDGPARPPEPADDPGEQHTVLYVEEVLRRLLADPRTAQGPAVVVSADVSPGHIERVLAAGARESLTKPLDAARFGPWSTGCWPAWPAGPDPAQAAGPGTRATQRTDWPNPGRNRRSRARSAGTTRRS